MAVGAQLALDHEVGGGECGVDVAGLEAAAHEHVVGRLLVDHRGAAGSARRARVDDRRQRIAVEDDEVGGVLGEVAVGGDDRGDRLAVEADPVAGEERLGGLDVGAQRRPRPQLAARDLGIVAGHHRDHARRGPRGVGVDAADAPVGERAAHEGDVEHSGETQVADIATATGEQPGVLLAGDARPQHGHAQTIA